MSLETRTFHDVEVRADGEKRLVSGVAVPFDRPTDIGQYTEVFRKGAFARTIKGYASKVKLLNQHRSPIGSAMTLRESDEGLIGEFRISATAEGNDVIELVKDGVLDSFSVGFSPVQDRWSKDRTSVERTEVRLMEVSLVPFPAYEDAKVMAYRDSEPTIVTMSIEEARRIAVDLHLRKQKLLL